MTKCVTSHCSGPVRSSPRSRVFRCTCGCLDHPPNSVTLAVKIPYHRIKLHWSRASYENYPIEQRDGADKFTEPKQRRMDEPKKPY